MMDLCFKCIEEMSNGKDPFTAILNRGLDFVEGLIRGPLKGNERAAALVALLMNNNFIEIGVIERERSNQTQH
jgi:hypothetical protein